MLYISVGQPGVKPEAAGVSVVRTLSTPTQAVCHQWSLFTHQVDSVSLFRQTKCRSAEHIVRAYISGTPRNRLPNNHLFFSGERKL